MTDDLPPPLPDPPPWKPPERLVELGRPAHEIFSDFIGECSPDPDTRTVVITSLVLALWQLKGCDLTPDVPSLLLVHTGEATDDPIDAFTRGLVYNEEANRPRVRTEGAFTCGPVELAPKAMRNAVLERRSLGAAPGDRERARQLEERFWAAQATGYGHGCCRPYSEAWHAEHGWLTDRQHQVILRLDRAPDRAAFRDDVLEDPCKLVFPQGVGGDLWPAPKGICLSGSLAGELCDGKIVSHTVALGLPFFLLPHATEEPLTADGLAAVETLATVWQHEPALPVVPSLRLAPSAAAYEVALRRHLSRLPATYEFAVLQAVHQLDGICDRIARFAGGTEAGMEELVGLCQGLYDHTLRGMAVSVAGLSYFGRGLDLDKAALKLLRCLRERGATRCSALPGNLHIKAQQRDTILERLGEEGLVRVEDGVATATTLAEFTRGLYAREEFSGANGRRAGR